VQVTESGTLRVAGGDGIAVYQRYPHQEAHVIRQAVKRTEAMAETCALDVVEARPRGATLEEIAGLLGLTRERIRQVEQKAKRRIDKDGGLQALFEALDLDGEAESVFARKRRRDARDGSYRRKLKVEAAKASERRQAAK